MTTGKLMPTFLENTNNTVCIYLKIHNVDMKQCQLMLVIVMVKTKQEDNIV